MNGEGEENAEAGWRINTMVQSSARALHRYNRR
jgi:hypothetical protein